MYLNQDGSFNVATVAQSLYETLLASKQISRTDVTKEEIEKVLKLITRVNSLTEFDRSLDGVRLDEVVIPKSFKDFVMPSKISFMVGESFPNLRIIPEKDVLELDWSIAEMTRINNKINSTFKAHNELVSVASLRDKGTFSDHFCMAQNDDKEFRVNAQDSYNSVPVPVYHAWSLLVGEHYLNESAEYAMEKYLEKFNF